MLRLILRQIWKHRGPLSVLLLVWGLIGYFIFSYRHDWFSAVARFLVSTPVAGVQDPDEARPFVESALERLKDDHVDLDLMARTCYEYLPRHYYGDPAAYRPHWLEKLRAWRLEADAIEEDSTSLSATTATPDTYWEEHRPAVLESMRDLVAALNFAYEVDLETDDGERHPVLVPELFAAHARAVCQEQLGRMAWGDYAKFQEARAWRTIRERRGIDEEDEETINLDEKQRLIIESLRGNQRYQLALREYAAGSPPELGNRSVCLDGWFRLACVAPEEAAQVYRKLLIVADSSENVGLYHMNLAHTLMLVSAYAEERPLLPQQEAISHFQLATQYRSTEQDARMALAHIYVQRGKDDDAYYRDAYEELTLLSQMSRLPGFRHSEYRRLARATLMGLERFKDADCFAEMAPLPYGTRDHCATLVL